MELTKITDKTMYINGPANIGVILLEQGNVALIDSGLDHNYAKKVFSLLSDYRFKVTLILNTHSHADHTGGNNFFQDKYKCRIMAPILEIPMIQAPLIQSAVLFSGAPIPDLLNKFIMPYPSKVEEFDEDILQKYGIKLHDIPGHSVNQKGFIVNDTAYLADTLFPVSFFSKQRLPFHYDPIVQLETLLKLQKLDVKFFVGGHFKPTSDIKPMITENIKHIKSAISFMLEFLNAPQPQDRIVKSFMDHFDLKKKGWEHFLYRATINGYLSALYKHKKIKYRVLDNLLMWYAI